MRRGPSTLAPAWSQMPTTTGGGFSRHKKKLGGISSRSFVHNDPQPCLSSAQARARSYLPARFGSAPDSLDAARLSDIQLLGRALTVDAGVEGQDAVSRWQADRQPVRFD